MKITEEIYGYIYETAVGELGEKEIPGRESNPEILKYFLATNVPKGLNVSDETAWCAAFVSWVIEVSGLDSLKTLWALSYKNWGIPLEKPRKGCLVVLSRGASNGHVGFYDSENEDYVYILGGNQKNSVSIAKFDKSRVLAYRGVKLTNPADQIVWGNSGMTCG